MNVNPTVRVATVLYALVIPAVAVGIQKPAFADRPGVSASAVVDPKARALLTHMANAYRSLESCSLKIEIKQGAGMRQDSIITGSIAFKRPSQAAVTMKSGTEETTAVADGKFITLASATKKEYAKIPAGTDGQTIFHAIQAAGGDLIGLLPFTAAGNDPYTIISRNLKSLTVLAPDIVSGTPVDVVQAIETSAGHGDATMTLAIGHSDHLLRRVGFLASDGGLVIIETLSNVKANPPLPDSLFHFAPPAGYKAVQ